MPSVKKCLCSTAHASNFRYGFPKQTSCLTNYKDKHLTAKALRLTFRTAWSTDCKVCSRFWCSISVKAMWMGSIFPRCCRSHCLSGFGAKFQLGVRCVVLFWNKLWNCGAESSGPCGAGKLRTIAIGLQKKEKGICLQYLTILNHTI